MCIRDRWCRLGTQLHRSSWHGHQLVLHHSPQWVNPDSQYVTSVLATVTFYCCPFWGARHTRMDCTMPPLRQCPGAPAWGHTPYAGAPLWSMPPRWGAFVPLSGSARPPTVGCLPRPAQRCGTGHAPALGGHTLPCWGAVAIHAPALGRMRPNLWARMPPHGGLRRPSIPRHWAHGFTHCGAARMPNATLWRYSTLHAEARCRGTLGRHLSFT